MKKLKRKELINQIVKEIGLTKVNKTSGYFSRNQLLDLIVEIRNMKSEIQNLTDGDNGNDGVENSPSD